MKYCPNCGAASNDNALFCGECGTPLNGGAAPGGNEAQGTVSYEQPVVEPKVDNTAYNNTDQNGGYQNNGYQNAGYQNNGYQNGGYQNNGYQNNGYQGGGYGYQNNSGIVPRSIPVAIILSLVTCGIYGIYWMIKINDEVNQLSGDINGTSGGMVVLFTLITCGIYGWFWIYKMGQKVDAIKGMPGGNSAILYLLLQFFGLGIVNYCLIQDVINKAVQ